MAEITLKVTGMHCSNCTWTVEHEVSKLEGVDGVKADYEADTVELAYNGEDAVLEAAKAAIAEAGFTVVD